MNSDRPLKGWTPNRHVFLYKPTYGGQSSTERVLYINLPLLVEGTFS